MSPQLVEVVNMEWLIPSLVGIGLFLVAQAGALIWFLSAVKRDLCYIRKALDSGEHKFEDHVEKIDAVEDRVTILETTCKETHKRRA